MFLWVLSILIAYDLSICSLSFANGHAAILEEPVLPPSRPLTPTEQMDIMHSIEMEELAATVGEPSKTDTEVLFIFGCQLNC